MIDSNFVSNFIAKSNTKLSDEEIKTFNEAAGFDKAMSLDQRLALYDKIHEIYDIEMDEMDEELNNKIEPTYQLIMQYMINNW